MPREKENYRNNLQRLIELYPNQHTLTVKDVTQYLGVDRRSLLADETIRFKKAGSKYIIPITNFANWLS